MTWSAPARAARFAFSRAAHGGDDRGVGPPGELDRGVADGPGTSGDQDRATLQRARAEPRRTVLGHGQAAVRGQEGHPEAGAEVERRDVRQQHHVAGRHDGVLLRGAAGGTQVGRLPDPDPQAQQRRLDALPDGVDHPGAVLVRHLRRVRRRRPAPLPRRDFQSVGLTPERWIRTRTSPGPGSGTGRSTRRQDVRVTGHGVLDRAHAPDGIPRRWRRHRGARRAGRGLDGRGSAARTDDWTARRESSLRQQTGEGETDDQPA